MKNNIGKKVIFNYNYFLLLLVIVLIFAIFLIVLLFFVYCNFNFVGADSEINESNLPNYSKTNQKIYYSPNNPIINLDEDYDYQNKKINNQYPDKLNIIYNFQPLIYSYLNEADKLKLSSDLDLLLLYKKIEKEEIFNSIIPDYKIILSIIYTDTFAKSIIAKSYSESISSKFYQEFLFYRKIYLFNKSTIFGLPSDTFNTTFTSIP